MVSLNKAELLSLCTFMGQVALYRASGPEHEEESARVGRLSFVDLAGSERANRTGNVGARLKYTPFSQSSCL
jgi:hypothetical protein